VDKAARATVAPASPVARLRRADRRRCAGGDRPLAGLQRQLARRFSA